MTAFSLKVIAMATMLCDHIGFVFCDNHLLMRNIGRLAFIIYAFLMAEAYYHLEHKPDRIQYHVGKLLILFAVSEIPYDLIDHGTWDDPSTQNVIATLLLGFLSLAIAGQWRKRHPEPKWIGAAGTALIYLAAAFVSYCIRSEYKFAGVLLVIFFYHYLRHADSMKLPVRIAALALVCAAYIGIYLWSRSRFGGITEIRRTAAAFRMFLPGNIIAFFPLAFYNRRQGYRSRWFDTAYSLFYPVQFIMIYIITKK